jgi:hypothetical protein
MNDDAFNMSMRKFLKKVGVTSQQQIEAAIRTARENGTLGAGPLNATMRLSIPEIGLDQVIEGRIALQDGE